MNPLLLLIPFVIAIGCLFWMHGSHDGATISASSSYNRVIIRDGRFILQSRECLAAPWLSIQTFNDEIVAHRAFKRWEDSYDEDACEYTVRPDDLQRST